MNTSTPLDPRSLAHRLTTVGHALHHRLFAQLRDGDIHPKTALLLGVIDGRIDSPWIRERLARGGKRITALAERGWVERSDDGWTLTAAGREILDRVDADRAALLADVPAEELARLAASLDAVAEAMGVDDAEERRFGPRGRGGFGPGMRGGFGPGMRRGFGPGFGPGMHRGFGPDASDAHGTDHHGHDDHGHHTAHGHDGHHARGHRHGEHGHGERGHHGRGHGAAQRAYERGFDAGFSRGRESSASE